MKNKKKEKADKNSEGYHRIKLPSLKKGNQLILEPKDMNKTKWKFVCDLFTTTDPEQTSRIVISKERGIEYFIE